MKARYDKRRKVATTYRIGYLVLWRQASTVASEKGVNRILTNKYNGPYKVTAVLDSLRRYISVPTTDGVGVGDGGSSGEAMVHYDLIDLLDG
ncbi:hypothetical protein Trydic_g1769 [Trypoxylus dichotomus]